MPLIEYEHSTPVQGVNMLMSVGEPNPEPTMSQLVTKSAAIGGAVTIGSYALGMKTQSFWTGVAALGLALAYYGSKS